MLDYLPWNMIVCILKIRHSVPQKCKLQHYCGKTGSIAVARLWVTTLGESSLLWEHPLHYCY